MADISRTIEIIFGAVDNTGNVLGNLSDNINNAVENTSRLTEPLANVADYALKAETAITALAAVYGGYASAKASEFQAAQIDLNKVLSDSDPSIGSFTDSVMKLSEQYGVSSAQILQGIANFKQAGFTAEEAAQLQKSALDLMIAGDVEAAKASEILVSAIKGFGVEADQASRFVEALNNVSNDYATDVAQLAEGMQRVAPIASTMGFSFEETTGLLTPMIEIFGSGAEAAEGLKTGLLKLIDDSKPVSEALKSIGVAQFDTNGQLRSGKDIFYDVAEAFKTVDENQKLYLTSQLVGIDQAPRMVLAFDNLAKVQEITASALKETGSATKEVELRLASTEKQAAIFATAFENLAIVIGTKVNEQFAGLVSGSTDVVSAFRQVVEDGGLDAFFEALRPTMEQFAETLTNIARNLPEAMASVDFSGLINSLGSVKDSIVGLFGDLDLNTPEGLTRAIQFVVDTLESLNLVVAGIIESWDPFVAGIVAGVEAFNNLDSGTKETFGNLTGLAQVFETLKSSIIDGADALDTIGSALTAIAGIQATSAVATLGTALGSAGLAGAAAVAAGAVGYTAGTGLAHGLDTLLSVVTGSETTLGGFIYDITHMGEEAGNTATKLDETEIATRAFLQSVTRLGETNIETLFKTLKDNTGESITGMAGLRNALDEGRITLDEAKIALVETAQATDTFGDSVENAGDMSWFNAEVAKIAESLNLGGEAAEKASKGFYTLEEAQAYAREAFAQSNNVVISYADGLWKVGEGGFNAADGQGALAEKTKEASNAAVEGSAEWKRVQDVLLGATKEANDFKVKMGQLSNERYEIQVKAAVDLQVAQIEADTARIQAVMDATASAISDLTASATDLWGTFTQNTDSFKETEIENAALRMEQRLDEELLLKRQLAEAIMAQAFATSQRLASGQPLISIDGGQLTPELEMIFDKILEYTQIRATNEGLNLLLGI